MRTIRRRRLEKKTDYKARLALLKSNRPRLVLRKTNSYVIAQIIETKDSQDHVLVGITSKILLDKGWPKENEGSLKNKVAAYLTGFLIGKLAQEKGIKSAILDIGMHRNVHKSRLYALLKGSIDAGLKIPHNPEALPTEQELQKNEKFKQIINKIIK